jgi:glyoxylase-like metal-dependent hydrolase (beta-lactamase superfamily II)
MTGIIPRHAESTAKNFAKTCKVGPFQTAFGSEYCLQGQMLRARESQMKAWGLFLFLVLAMAGCASGQRLDVPLDRYGGEPLPDFEGFDRAGVEVIKGGFPPGRQPDGNTVLLASHDGLIVFDTGRHDFHTQKIIDRAGALKQPVAAIINSHWHLDHVSGNIPLRARYPDADVYSNGAAIENALATFLARGRESNQKLLADPTTTPEIVDEIRIDAATVDQGQRLKPTVSIEARQVVTIGGRRLEFHTAKGASDGDIWVFDPASGVVMTGDLVTLPAPFLDTPCPVEWSNALEAVLATSFTRAMPGHGREMTRSEITLYRDAFNALVACAAGDAEPIACADAWAAAVAPLQENPELDNRYARGMSRNYVENVLRKDGLRKDCAA